MTSCQSAKVVVIKTTIPYLDFPEFPPIHRVIQEDGSWLIDKASADRLAEYYEQITAVENTYKETKEMWENTKDATY